MSLRQLAFGSMLAASAAALISVSLADEVDAGTSPGVALIRNGIAGAGNELAKPPVIDIKAGNMALTLGTSPLGDVVAKLGSQINDKGEGGDRFVWACYVSPAASDTPSMLLWFASNDFEAANKPLTHVAVEAVPATIPPGCTILEVPLALTTGAPAVGATKAELDAAFGQPENVEPDGTILWMFGSEPAGDGINVRRTELKYRFVDGKVIAAEVGMIYEMQ